MLNILIPSTGPSKLSFSLFEEYGIPPPLSGVDEEVNGDVILKFEDEEEAIAYSEQMENMANELNDKSTTQHLAINDIIVAIRDDEFVQSYFKEN